MNKNYRVVEHSLDPDTNPYAASTLYIPQGSRIVGAFAEDGVPYVTVLQPYNPSDPGDHKLPTSNVEYWVANDNEELPSWAEAGQLHYVGCAQEASFQGNTLASQHWHVFILEGLIAYPPEEARPWEKAPE
jgi:hypothetical protein